MTLAGTLTLMDKLIDLAPWIVSLVVSFAYWALRQELRNLNAQILLREATLEQRVLGVVNGKYIHAVEHRRQHEAERELMELKLGALRKELENCPRNDCPMKTR